MRYEEQQENLMLRNEPKTELRATDRDGEIVIMVVNTMRQLYKRMLDQCFISGTVYMGYMAVADVVSDFAIFDVAKKKNKLKAWKDIFRLDRETYQRMSEQELDEDITREAEGTDSQPSGEIKERTESPRRGWRRFCQASACWRGPGTSERLEKLSRALTVRILRSVWKLKWLCTSENDRI